jgi:hypothetical protein
MAGESGRWSERGKAGAEVETESGDGKQDCSESRVRVVGCSFRIELECKRLYSHSPACEHSHSRGPVRLQTRVSTC